MDLAQRAQATQKVVARYRGKPATWSVVRCIKLARAQGKALGHELPPIPAVRSALGVKKALKKQRCESVEDLLDKYFERLPSPAFAVVGDLVMLPSEDGLGAVCIADGHGCMIGWHDAHPEGLSNITLSDAEVGCAWRA